MKVLLLSILAVIASVNLAAAQSAPIVVYDDGLKDGWSDISTNVVTHQVVMDDILPLKVEGDAYTALAFLHVPFETKGLSRVSFYVNGGEKGGQTLIVRATQGGKPTAKSYVVTLNSSAWNYVEIPLTEFGEGLETLDGLWFQTKDANRDAPYYITLIQFD